MFRKNNQLTMTSGPIVGPLFLFILPIIGSGIFQQLYNTVDFIFIGNLLNKTSAAAVGAASTIINCCIGIFSGISVGASVVVAQCIGADEKKTVNHALHTSLLFGLIGGLVIMLVGMLFAPGILILLNTPQNVIPEAVVYLRIYLISIPMMVFYNMGSGAIRATGDSKSPFYILVICGVANVIFDAVFLMIFPLGVAGVAVATALSQGFSAVLLVVVLFRSQTFEFSFSSLRMDSAILRKILEIGIPCGVQTVLITVSNIFVQYFINSFGEVSVAGFATYYKVENFIYLPIMAFGQGITTFVGQNIGASEKERARKGTRIMVLICMALTACISALILGFSDTVFGWFMKDVSVAEAAILIASVSFPFYFFYSILEVYGSAIRGMGDSVASMIIVVSCLGAFRVLLLFAFSSSVGTLSSIAAVYPITWGATAICMVIRYLYLFRRKHEII